MNLLPFEALPVYQPRRFVPEVIDLGEWAQVAPLFEKLETRGNACPTVEELERWLLDWSELTAALDEEKNRRYVAMTCHTDNADAEKAYLHFVEQIEPHTKPCEFRLEKVLTSHPLCGQLPMPRYEVLLRDVRNRVALFREENVALETEEARLTQQYHKLCGSLTVTFRGEEKTLTQMGKFLEEPDRPLRRESWELVARRRLAEREKFEDLFDQLLALREKIAANAGFANYRDYMFRRLSRFDYTPADCTTFHDAVAQEVMPALDEVRTERRRRLGLDRLRPWDLAVDPLNRPPLRPFTEVGQMLQGTQRIFDRLDAALACEFRSMQALRLLDLENRKGKAPGGYQSTMSESRLPFIFMNAVGQQNDVETLLHEAGHAFHAMAARDENLLAYRNGPTMEFCEVASMSMELLGNEFLEEFYPSADANRARRTRLEANFGMLGWIATIDAFQHWIYTHPGHTRTERATAWNALMDRFAGNVDWSGYEQERAFLWHRQLHLFIVPFYYIEYGIAQLGALQVWANSKADPQKALADYKTALALGGSRPLPELFETAGCQFRFDAPTIRRLVGLVQTELRKLN
ncbi:MAG TPA: M3 family oligoendopeptidase [Chthoniobacter sp.]|jgi:oligoendopeptidase F